MEFSTNHNLDQLLKEMKAAQEYEEMQYMGRKEEVENERCAKQKILRIKAILSLHSQWGINSNFVISNIAEIIGDE